MKNSNKKGFTLVELVVVIAIIGVLAAILVPSLMGYVRKSRLKTANGNAKTAYNAIAEYQAERETQGEPITWSTATSETFQDYNAKSDDAGNDVKHLLYKALASNGSEAGCVTVGAEKINDEDTFFVQWRKTTSDDIFGQYPDAIKDVDTALTNSVGKFVSK